MKCVRDQGSVVRVLGAVVRNTQPEIRRRRSGNPCEIGSTAFMASNADSRFAGSLIPDP